MKTLAPMTIVRRLVALGAVRNVSKDLDALVYEAEKLLKPKPVYRWRKSYGSYHYEKISGPRQGVYASVSESIWGWYYSNVVYDKTGNCVRFKTSKAAKAAVEAKLHRKRKKT